MSINKVLKNPTSKLRKPPKIVPNVFVAFRVRNEQTINPILDIHERLRNFDKKFESKLVPTRALHITLMVAKLEQDQEENAKKAMETVGQAIREQEKKLQIHFHGINSFGSRVLFGAVKEECLEPLRDLQKLVVEAFDNQGVKALDNRPIFHPHLTIARGPRRKDENHLAEELVACISEDVVLGSEEIEELLLCKMNMDKVKDEFYKIIHSESLVFGNIIDT